MRARRLCKPVRSKLSKSAVDRITALLTQNEAVDCGYKNESIPEFIWDARLCIALHIAANESDEQITLGQMKKELDFLRQTFNQLSPTTKCYLSDVWKAQYFPEADNTKMYTTDFLDAISQQLDAAYEWLKADMALGDSGTYLIIWGIAHAYKRHFQAKPSSTKNGTFERIVMIILEECCDTLNFASAEHHILAAFRVYPVDD